MVHRNIQHASQRGTILVEWLVAITILLCIVALGSSVVTSSSPRQELNMCTEEVVYAIKKVQLWSMLGHHDDTMSQGEFVLKKHNYSIREGYDKSYMENALPSYIESNHVLKRVYFSSYGLPHDGTEFILRDIRTGATNRIWISVQTGRIRWEVLQ